MSVTQFKGYTDIGTPSLTEVIEDNIVTYIDWGFLELGAFFNIDIPSSGAYGGDRHKLRSINDPRYTDGQIWEGYRQNWVWESGLDYSTQPTSISGIFVDGEFYPKGSGYHINYKNGQVVFDTPIDTSSEVKLEYSHKWITSIGSDNLSWLQQLQTHSFRTDDRLLSANSGIWNKLADSRLQLPFVAVETVNKEYEGYQLGGGQWARTEVLLHVVAENAQTAKRISSILSSQNEKTIYLFDPGKMADDNAFPLDYRGEIASGALCYPDLISPTGDGGYRYTSGTKGGKMRIFDITEQQTNQLTNNVYHSKVRWNTEVILQKI
ncbi:MAG: hypothetical protein R6V36_10045 [Psychroflexus sp.]